MGRKEVYRTGEISRICQVAARTVCKWIDSGILRGWRVPDSTDRRVMHKTLVQFMRDRGMGELTAAILRRVLFVGLSASEQVAVCGLESEDYLVVAAANGFDAGVIFAEHNPDTVVIDLSIGRSEGLAIGRRIKAVKPEAALIALASEDEASPWEIGEAGFAGILERPFDVALLVGMLTLGSKVDMNGKH